jgi:hypothetical protein
MEIVRLVWFFLWRMTLLGLGLGATLGAAYGAAVMGLGALVTDLVDNGGALANYLTLLGAVVLLGAYGVVFGLLLGTLTGLVLGAVDGLLLGVLTQAFYRAPADVRNYHRVGGLMCAAASVLALLAGWWQQGFEWHAFAFASLYPGAFGGGLGDLILVMLLPSFVATLAMWWAGRLVARWYTSRPRGGAA